MTDELDERLLNETSQSTLWSQQVDLRRMKRGRWTGGEWKKKGVE